MKFYTLIHICSTEISIHNNSQVKSFDEQILLYFRCAQQLHYSLKTAGFELVVLTNDKAFLNRIETNQYQIEIKQLDFELDVPSGVPFFSAHFKVELYKYLGTLSDDYLALIDCDILCINDIPTSFKNCIANKVPLYYDVTDQMAPAYGAERIIKDKERLSKTKSLGLWAGGEFMAGPPEFFKRLYAGIESVKEEYFKNFSQFFAQSDEMIISVVIENILLSEHARLLDAGGLSIINRFWSPRPKHAQKSLDGFKDHFLLHLPSDKKFIANLDKRKLRGNAFFKAYKYHFAKYRFLHTAYYKIKPLLKAKKNVNG